MLNSVRRSAALLACSALSLAACLNDPVVGPAYGTPGSGGSGGSGSATSGKTGSGVATSGGTGGNAPTLGALSLALDVTTPQLDLKDRVDLKVSIDPKGYSGPLSLSVGDLSSKGITTMLASTMVTLDGTTVQQVALTLETASDTPPTDVPFTVTGAAGAGMKTVTGTITINPAITIHIPLNVGAMAGTVANPYKLAFGDYPTNITAPAGISAATPVTVRFANDDNVSHEIHASQGAEGFPHDPGSIPAHTTDSLVRKVTAKDTYDFYLHDQVDPITVGRIVIQ